MTMRNLSASDANKRLASVVVDSGQGVEQHMERMHNLALYFSRPVTAYTDDPILKLCLIHARLRAFNGMDMSEKEMRKYLRQAKEHGLC